MAKGRDKDSVFKPNEADKRLARYKKRVKKGLEKYGDDKQKFISLMAQVMLSEVRNERKMIQEISEEIEAIFKDFKLTDDNE